MGSRKITFSIDDKTYDLLRRFAFDHKVSMARLIREGIVLRINSSTKPKGQSSNYIPEVWDKPTDGQDLSGEFHPVPREEK